MYVEGTFGGTLLLVRQIQIFIGTAKKELHPLCPSVTPHHTYVSVHTCACDRVALALLHASPRTRRACVCVLEAAWGGQARSKVGRRRPHHHHLKKERRRKNSDTHLPLIKKLGQLGGAARRPGPAGSTSMHTQTSATAPHCDSDPARPQNDTGAQPAPVLGERTTRLTLPCSQIQLAKRAQNNPGPELLGSGWAGGPSCGRHEDIRTHPVTRAQHSPHAHPYSGLLRPHAHAQVRAAGCRAHTSVRPVRT